MAPRREYQRGRRTGGAGAPEKRAHHGRLAAARVARLSVHARADPARLRRAGAVGEHDADGQRRVDPHRGSHLAARCDAGREHADDYVRPRARRHVHGGRRADRSVRASSARRCRSGSRPTRRNTSTSPRPTTSWFRAGSKTVRSSMPTAASIRTTAAATAWRFTARTARWR